MTTSTPNVVRVSRQIEAPAQKIFAVLADPRRHIDIDGSEMVRGSEDSVLKKVNDVFIMRMFFTRHGDYVMSNRVIEFEQDRKIGWEPTRIAVEGEDSWHQRWLFELEPLGVETTLVSEIYDCTRVPDEEKRAMKGGSVWISSMNKTLERLEQVVKDPRSPQGE